MEHRGHLLALGCHEHRRNIHVLKEAKRLEEEGNKVLKLNIGNPAPFGFDAPDEILVDVIRNLPTAQGYCDSKGLFSARKAIMQHYQARGMRDVTVEDIYIGNGVSELIVQAMQALLNSGDEMLVPAPDYPLWTAAVSLSSGKAVHYLCDESSDWFPDLDDIRSKITPRTRGIVIINPNNPTGAVYSKELLMEIVEIARQHNLIIFADEIYDKILYDEAQHHAFVIHDVATQQARAALAHQVAYGYPKRHMASINQQARCGCGEWIPPAGHNADKHKFRCTGQNRNREYKGYPDRKSIGHRQRAVGHAYHAHCQANQQNCFYRVAFQAGERMLHTF
jgi:DNA-binding transcriptional MocR family regulator